MTVKFAFTLLLFISFFSNPEIAEIRKIYRDAVNSESKAKEFSLKLSHIDKESDKTLVAYKGASITLVSKFAKNVPDKISNFKEGAKLVEYAETAEPGNIEIRLIRLSIQENVPPVVKYKKNIKEDRDFILAHYKEQNNSLKDYVISFIRQSKSFTAAEKQGINN
jgi:hypothetical protein